MRQAWSEFIRNATPRSHAAHVYADQAELAESVVSYLAAGFERGEPALLVTVAEHVPMFSEGLGSAGWGYSAAQESGLLLVADADATLAEIMDGARLSPERFETVIGGKLDELATRGRPRVFGEMVDVLVRRGQPEAADELERSWNGLAERREFSLLCGYALDVFDRAVQSETLPHVCREHSHVLPARNYPRFASAVDEALREVLGPSEAAGVYVRVSREAEKNEGAHVPLAQLLLMWVATNLPKQSSRILDAARFHYARAA